MRKEQGVPNFPKNEEEVLKFWQDNQIFEKLKAKNKKTGKYYTLLDGPITANYNMGLHHAFARTFKDATIKYRALKGYNQHYQNGFDAHGLPVEVGVEKELGIDNELSVRYKSVVKQADNMRMLYASHILKQRNSVLPVIKEKLMSVKESEKQILTEFVEKVKERIK